MTFAGVVGWLDDQSDRLSPLVVKEVRQVVRGREFSLSFGASLVAGLIVAFLGATDAVAGGTSGRWTFVALMACLGILGLVVVPLGAFGALRRERIEQTFDLITLTALSSRRVIVGKLMAQAVRLTTLFAAMAPFVAMSFLLGGIDFVTITISLVVLFMASLWVCALCVFLSALARSRAVSGVIFVAVGIALLFAAIASGIPFRALTMGLFFGAPGGPGLTASDILWMLAIVTTGWLVTMVNLVLLAVNRLSLTTEDSVTPLRLGFLAQLLLMAGWALAFVFDPLPSAKAAGYVLAVLGGLHLTMVAAFAVTESPIVPRRARMRIELGSFQGWLVTVFGPGSGRGPGTLILHLVILVLALVPFPIDADDRRLTLASYAYLIFFVSVPTLAFRTLLPQYATPLRLRVALLVTLAVATALPDLLYYLIRQPDLLDIQYSGRHLLSPLQTIANWQTVEKFGWMAAPFAVGAVGLLALIVLVHTGVQQAAEDASITPHRPASAAGEPGRADLIY